MAGERKTSVRPTEMGGKDQPPNMTGATQATDAEQWKGSQDGEMRDFRSEKLRRGAPTPRLADRKKVRLQDQKQSRPHREEIQDAPRGSEIHPRWVDKPLPSHSRFVGFDATRILLRWLPVGIGHGDAGHHLGFTLTHRSHNMCGWSYRNTQ